VPVNGANGGGPGNGQPAATTMVVDPFTASPGANGVVNYSPAPAPSSQESRVVVFSHDMVDGHAADRQTVTSGLPAESTM
jgi:hypothetical protein